MQLIAELGTPVWFTFTVSRQGRWIGSRSTCESKVTHTTRLKKSACLRIPATMLAPFGEAAGPMGLPSGQLGSCPALAPAPSPGRVSCLEVAPASGSLSALRGSVGSPWFSPKKSVSTGNLCFRLESRFTIGLGGSRSFLCFCAISAVSTTAQELHLRDVLLPCRILYGMNHWKSAMYFRVRLAKSLV